MLLIVPWFHVGFDVEEEDDVDVDVEGENYIEEEIPESDTF